MKKWAFASQYITKGMFGVRLIGSRVFSMIYLFYFRSLESSLRSSKIPDAQRVLMMQEFRRSPENIPQILQRQAQVIEKISGIIEKPGYIQLDAPVNRFSDYDNIARDMSKKGPHRNVQVRPGLLTNTGKLVVASTEGAIGGVAVFATEAGVAGYHYLQGNTLKPEFERQIQDAAIKGMTVGGATAVAVFLVPNPAGLVILGIASAAYIATDTSLKTWRRYQDSKYLNRIDLLAFGIELDSILDIHTDSVLNARDRQSPLNAEQWGTGSALSPESWAF